MCRPTRATTSVQGLHTAEVILVMVARLCCFPSRSEVRVAFERRCPSWPHRPRWARDQTSKASATSPPALHSLDPCFRSNGFVGWCKDRRLFRRRRQWSPSRSTSRWGKTPGGVYVRQRSGDGVSEVTNIIRVHCEICPRRPCQKPAHRVMRRQSLIRAMPGPPRGCPSTDPRHNWPSEYKAACNWAST